MRVKATAKAQGIGHVTLKSVAFAALRPRHVHLTNRELS